MERLLGYAELAEATTAWSYAMEKKQVPDGPNTRQHLHLIGRLRKAMKWADHFTQLCAVKGDSRTSLQAAACASYMRGSLLLEREQNWESALMNFKSARAVYDKLGKYGDDGRLKAVANEVINRSNA
eukprot:Gb_35760 [translate_table: standard]